MDSSSAAHAARIDHCLRSNKVLVCAGSGGVGKTTIAAALGVRAAQIGLRVLVLTVDPARRLATALGLNLADDAEKQVPVPEFGGRLYAAVIDSRKTFDDFIVRHSAQPAIAERILKNRLYKQMSTTLSGSQEFTSLERLLSAVESGRHDIVILDTPPTKHAMDFLNAPHRINALFQDNITKWFLSGSERMPGFISSIVSRGTRTVIKSMEVLTGGQFIEELIDFFAAVNSLQKVLRERSHAVHALLTGPQTKFFLVTSFDAAKLAEAQFMQRALKELGYRLQGVIINRAFPLWLPGAAGVEGGDAHKDVHNRLMSFYNQFREYYRNRYRLYEEFARGLDAEVEVVRIPEYNRDIHGLKELQELAAKMAQGHEA